MNNTKKHTPGPWQAVQLGGRASIIDEINGLPIADFYDRTNGEFHNEAYANAIVSAAAPEMLAALKVFAEIQSRGKTHSDAFLNEVLRIIKKAQP